jgi:hypothetical protein
VTDDRENRDLERAFAALRAEDRRHAPELERLLARPPAAGASQWPAGRLRAAAIAALLLAVAALLWMTPPRGGKPPEIDAAQDLLAWRSPTDGLLETPGHALLETLPEVGRIDLPALPADVRSPKAPADEPPRDRKETP